MIFPSFLVVIFAFFSTVSCAFEFKCSAKSLKNLDELVADANKFLEKTANIWSCGNKHLKDNDDSLAYSTCITDLNLPLGYSLSVKLMDKDYFLSQEAFKTEIERIGRVYCHESYYDSYNKEVKGGSFESENKTVFIIIGVVVVVGIVVGAILIYRNKNSKEEEAAYGANGYPSHPPNNPNFYPAQYPQVVTPAAGHYVAPNTFAPVPASPYYQGPQYSR